MLIQASISQPMLKLLKIWRIKWRLWFRSKLNFSKCNVLKLESKVFHRKGPGLWHSIYNTHYCNQYFTAIQTIFPHMQHIKLLFDPFHFSTTLQINTTCKRIKCIVSCQFQNLSDTDQKTKRQFVSEQQKNNELKRSVLFWCWRLCLPFVLSVCFFSFLLFIQLCLGINLTNAQEKQFDISFLLVFLKFSIRFLLNWWFILVFLAENYMKNIKRVYSFVMLFVCVLQLYTWFTFWGKHHILFLA